MYGSAEEYDGWRNDAGHFDFDFEFDFNNFDFDFDFFDIDIDIHDLNESARDGDTGPRAGIASSNSPSIGHYYDVTC